MIDQEDFAARGKQLYMAGQDSFVTGRYLLVRWDSDEHVAACFADLNLTKPWEFRCIRGGIEDARALTALGFDVRGAA